jgi:hypothetical protein
VKSLSPKQKREIRALQKQLDKVETEDGTEWGGIDDLKRIVAQLQRTLSGRPKKGGHS